MNRRLAVAVASALAAVGLSAAISVTDGNHALLMNRVLWSEPPRR
jgi:hypothetical protein